MYSIYLFTFPNGKKYCGYTSQEPSRRWNNGHGYNKCPLVWKAIVKYGWENVKRDIIYTTNNQDDAFNKEREIISQLQLTNINYGYNIDEGGRPHGSGDHLGEEGRKHLSEATKNRMSNPEIREKVVRKLQEHSQKMKGTHLSEETKRKISKTKRDQHLPAYNRKKVLQIDIDTGEILQEYESGTAAAKTLGKPSSAASNILAVCNNRRTTAYGYKWRFKEVV